MNTLIISENSIQVASPVGIRRSGFRGGAPPGQTEHDGNVVGVKSGRE